MQHASADGFNYLGTIDDVVLRYPWQFEMTKDRLEYSLIVQLINGRPVLLNDGYLLQHEVAVEAINNEESLLAILIEKGFVRVLARGFNSFGLHEMPERMKDHIPTMNALVNSPLWSELKPKVERFDRLLRDGGNYLGWPAFDLGSGFVELTKRLKERKSTPSSLGLGRIMTSNAFNTFIDEFLSLTANDKRGVRSRWEFLAKKHADNPLYTNDPQGYVRALMNLANEMYHYNFGILLSAELEVPVSVETQTSAAFDDLLVTKDILVSEIPGLPRLRVPKIIRRVSPRKLAEVLDPETDLGKARARWMELKYDFETSNFVGQDNRTEINAAAKEYCKRLGASFGEHIKYQETEGFIKYMFGEAVAPLSLFGLSHFSHGGWPADIAGFVAGFGINRLQDWGAGIVTQKFRVGLFERQILPPRLIQESERAMSKIKLRRSPSSLLLDKILARRISDKVEKLK